MDQADHTAPPLRPGSRVGAWTLLEPIGRGAFGTTWRASDVDGRAAALKFLDAPPGDELRALSRVCHPGVVGVIGGAGAPLPHLAMELARGVPLSDVLAAGIPEARALALGAWLADALAAIHASGVAHGDLKPANIVVESLEPAALKIVDFGLARSASGGTPAYAAPERAAGGVSSAPGDVYGLGLVLFEALHGHLPWADEDPAQGLLHRRKSAPEAVRGPPWLRELLGSMLAPKASRRPTAAQAADVFAAHGVPLPGVDLDLLRRRRHTLYVERPELTGIMQAHASSEGCLALIGPVGSGRSHALDQVAIELSARGAPWLRLHDGAHAWSGVERALADPGRAAPAVPEAVVDDPHERAHRAAEQIATGYEGRVTVLLDDWDLASAGTVLVLEALSRRRDALCLLTGAEAPSWAGVAHGLEPLDPQQTAALVRGLLGGSGTLDALVDGALTVGGGLPGATINFVLRAVEEGAVVPSNRSWVVDQPRLRALVDRDVRWTEAPQPELDEAAAAAGSVLALNDGPLNVPDLADLAGLSPAEADGAAQQLVERRLAVRQGDVLLCRTRDAREALAGLARDPAATHHALARRLLSRPDPPLDRVGHHAARAGDAELAGQVGPRAVAVALELDPLEASALADALWRLAPSAELAGIRVDALAASGQGARAVAEAEAWMQGREPEPEDGPVLLALARCLLRLDREPEAVEVLERARPWASALPAFIELQARASYQSERYGECIELCESAGGGPAPQEGADAWLDLRLLWAQALLAQGAHAEAVKLLDEVPGTAGIGTRARARLEGTLGRVLWHAGRVREAAAAMLRAADDEASLPTSERANLLNNAAVAQYHGGNLRDALDSWEQSLLLHQRLHQVSQEVAVLGNLCVGYLEAGRWERSRQAGVRALYLAGRAGLVELEARAAGNLGDLCMARNSFTEAQTHFQHAHDLATGHALHGELTELARRRAELALLTGDSRAAILADQALAAAREASDLFEQCRATAIHAASLARSGYTAHLDERIAEAIEPLRKAGAARVLAEVRLWVAEALFAACRLDEAVEEANRVVAYADEVGYVLLRNRADAFLARTHRAADAGSEDRRLNRLLELAVAVTRRRDLRELLDQVAAAAMELLDVDRCFVMVLRNGAPEVAATRTREGSASDQHPPAMTIVRRALLVRREVIAVDLEERGDLRAAPSVLAMSLRAAMCVPMVEQDQVLGAIYVDSQTASEQELTLASQAMRALAAHAAVAVTNARHLQDALRRSRRASELAHDVRNPANAVMFIASELRDPDNSEADLRELSDDLVEVSRVLSTMAERFLEDGASVHEPLNLPELLRSLVAVLAREARDRGLVIVLEADVEAWVVGDGQDLWRAFANVIGNAMKHSPQGGTIEVWLEVRGSQARVSVRDHGPGIPEQIRHTLFERGVQAPGAPHGYGLGLAIAQRFVLQHGGRIEADNHPEGGAVFTLRFPLCEAPRV